MATSSASPKTGTITVAHSPDSDDAFMFYGLATRKVRVPGITFEHTLSDIETLNRKAMEGVYDVTAISFHAYPYVQEKYALLPSGGSVGEGYGPMIVAARSFSIAEIKKERVAVPGTMTTAYLVLKLFAPDIRTEVVPFDQIIPQVLAGKHAAGLIIHEGQLTYSQEGLNRVVDLGKWWRDMTGLPLPLGGNAIRRDLGKDVIGKVAEALRESIQYALDHRSEALEYALQFARNMDRGLADKFVGMYVNERTLDYGREGREAVRRLLEMGYKAGIIPHQARVEFVGVGDSKFTRLSRLPTLFPAHYLDESRTWPRILLGESAVERYELKNWSLQSVIYRPPQKGLPPTQMGCVCVGTV